MDEPKRCRQRMQNQRRSGAAAIGRWTEGVFISMASTKNDPHRDAFPAGVPRYFLLGPDGTTVNSEVPGTLGGYRPTRVYGRLNCKTALSSLRRGRGYERKRVFFADEATAVAAGYRPCAHCMPDEYKAWKLSGQSIG
jgi:Metal binding domain of Ada